MKNFLSFLFILIMLGAFLIFTDLMPGAFYELPIVSDVVERISTSGDGNSGDAKPPPASGSTPAPATQQRPQQYRSVSDAVIQGIDEFNEKITVTTLLPDEDNDYITNYLLTEVEQAMEHIRRERPDVFWLALSPYTISWSSLENDVEGTVTIEIEYNHTRESARRLSNQMENTISRILTEAPGGRGAETARYFHDWIINNTRYDSAVASAGEESSSRGNEYAFNIDGVFIRGSAVCEGYTKAFKLLCDRAGIPNVSVFGYADDERHSWNYVQINQIWYLVDVTWDDPVGTVDILSSDFFLVGSHSQVNGRYIQDIYTQDSSGYPAISRLGYYE
jgi:hypothetical protein